VSQWGLWWLAGSCPAGQDFVSSPPATGFWQGMGMLKHMFCSRFADYAISCAYYTVGRPQYCIPVHIFVTTQVVCLIIVRKTTLLITSCSYAPQVQCHACIDHRPTLLLFVCSGTRTCLAALLTHSWRQAFHPGLTRLLLGRSASIIQAQKWPLQRQNVFLASRRLHLVVL
jgi:hypothetical protein